MEAVTIAIRTIVILTLATGSVFLELDKPGSSACFAQEFRAEEPELRPEEAARILQGLTLRREEEALRSLAAFGHMSEERWNTMTDAQRKAYEQVVRECQRLGIITVNWGDRTGRSFSTWEYLPGYTPPAALEPELRPEEAARFQIAEILVEEGKYAEAVNELEEILESTANEEVKNLARARISTIYAKMGLDEKSEGELKKIIESTTNLELKKRALMTLAGVYRSQKRYDEAVVALRQVIELTEPDVMKLLQFRKEFMPEGFTLSAAPPDWPVTGNPGWFTQEGLSELAEEIQMGVGPKRGYVCCFEKKGTDADDLYYILLEFANENTAAAAARALSKKIRNQQPDWVVKHVFAVSNLVVCVQADRQETVAAGSWLSATLLKALPAHLQPRPPKRRPSPVRIGPNEAAAIGALRSLMAAEEEFRFADIIDQDSDGAGEYGFFQELCGTVAPSGHAAPVLPEFFDPVFGIINASGAASKKYGYFFKVYLPGPAPAGPAVGEAKGANSATTNADAINNREKRWVCYAWPMDYARTGRRTFVVNQAGNIFATAAMVATYDETAVMPGANAAFVMGTKNINGALADGVGVDGNTWHPVK